jgi:glycosyltransferase involved in cell wall biosynthesis
MVAALAGLISQGEDVILDLVGWPEKDSNIVEEMKQVAQKNNVADRVVFHGYKPVGPALFNFYKQADIYLMASQTSEGFPRTIWEAMAHSLPVVATRVGSIPDFIAGAAELVEPKNPADLANGILRLIHNPSLRKGYIAKGFELAAQNNLEKQVGEMAAVIQEWVENRHA